MNTFSTHTRLHQTARESLAHSVPQLTNWHELQGQTIQAVFPHPQGDHEEYAIPADLILVFSDHSWCALHMQAQEFSDFVHHTGITIAKSGRDITTRLSAQQLLHAGLITSRQAKKLEQSNAARARRNRQEDIRQLKARLAQLEGEAA